MSFPEGISIVICTYNGVNRLQPTLEAIFKLKIPHDISWELIIVDNASTDDTTSRCIDLVEKHQFQKKVKIVQEPQAGCNYARLRGLQEASFKWLLFCDDDNHLFPDYIDKGWQVLHKNQKVGVLGGQGIPLFENEKPDWFDMYKSSFAVGPQSEQNGKITDPKRKLYSAGSFFNREVLMNYYNNGFVAIMEGPKGNELSRGEDTEWCIIIELAGYELWFNDELKFYHEMSAVRMTWPYYLKLKKGIASGAAKISTYDLFFKNKKPNNLLFILHYLKNLLYFNAIWLQFTLRKKISPARYTPRQIELGDQFNYTKAKVFRKNFLISFAHFKQLKSLFKKIAF